MPSTSSTTIESAFNSYTWNLNGQTYTQSGTYIEIGQCSSDTLILVILGLPDGWSQTIDGVNCNTGSSATYDIDSEEFELTSVNCYYANPFDSDQMAFIQRPLCGNGSITAEVRNITGGLGWAGLVMRENSAPGSKKIQLSVNRVSNFARREIRTTTNGTSYPQQFINGNRYYLRLTRQGNQFSGHTSVDGINWFFVMAGNITMNQCIDMGMMLTNYNSNSTIVATFGNVSFTGNSSNIVNQHVATRVVESMEDVAIFPNPATSEFTIEFESPIQSPTSVQVLDMNGRTIHNHILNDSAFSQQYRINVANWASGVYTVLLRSENGSLITKRIVVAPN